MTKTKQEAPRDDDKPKRKRAAELAEDALNVWAAAMKSRAELGLQHPPKKDALDAFPHESEWRHPTLARIEFVWKDHQYLCRCTDREGFTYEGDWRGTEDEALTDCDLRHPSINLVPGLRMFFESRPRKELREKIRHDVLSEIEAVERALDAAPRWMAGLLLALYPNAGRYDTGGGTQDDRLLDWSEPLFELDRDQRGEVVHRLLRPGGLDWIVAPLAPRGWDKLSVRLAAKTLASFKWRLRKEVVNKEYRAMGTSPAPKPDEIAS